MDERVAGSLQILDRTFARVAALVAAGRERYDHDDHVFDACQHCAVRVYTDLQSLGADWLEAHPEVPLHEIRGLRNRISHDYRSVDPDVLWDAVSVDIPELCRQLADEIEEAKRVLPD